MSLIKSKNWEIDYFCRKLSTKLSTHKNLWELFHKKKLNKEWLLKLKKGNKIKDATKKFLEDFNTWCGSFTNGKQLKHVLYRWLQLQEFINKIELGSYVKVHKFEEPSRNNLG